jgi:PAS domain-containing protein
MRVVCSYCRTDLGSKPPLEDESITHSMCPRCEDHFRRQWEGLSLGEYLDDFPRPVLVVSGENRVVAANRPMAELLGKPRRELYGLLGGEALECQHARLPEGCGRTIHCETCTIRRNVTRTLETGEPLERVQAHLDRDDGRTELLISTRLVEGLVQVVVEEMTPPKPRG